MEYPIELTPDDNGTYLVTCPDLPEVTTFCEGVDDALAHGADAVAEAIAARMDEFTDIPSNTTGYDYNVTLPLVLDLKVQLYWALQASGMNRAGLVKATGWSRTKVDRLFDPNHENKLTQLQEAFAALHQVVSFVAEPEPA